MDGAAGTRRLGLVSLGLLADRRIRRLLALAGWEAVPALRPCAAIGAWGRGRSSARAAALARARRLPLVTIEEPFLRGLHPGGSGTPPCGLLLDEIGVHFDAAQPSRLETLIRDGDLPDGRAALALWRTLGLSKTNAWTGEAPLPEPGYVLVIDQAAGDAAIAGGGAGPETFRAMLDAALRENPGARVLIRSHPEVAAGRRRGHFGPGDARGRVGFLDPRVPPPAALAGAARVHAVTSQMGFEAILAGHRPRLHGTPWYAGWGLAEEDRPPPARRGVARTAEQLFAAAFLALPVWHDPFRDVRTDFGTVARAVAAQAEAWRANALPAVCTGMRAWKRSTVRRFLAGPGRVAFEADPRRAVARAQALGGRVVVWAGREDPALAPLAAAAGVPLHRMEDGFLRSLGLGARLVTPASLVLDDLGIHYDPARPSRLEALIAAAAALPAEALARAAALRAALVAGAVTKYGAAPGELPAPAPGRRVILVAGQVEDDAGLRRAAGPVWRGRDLLAAARAAHPAAFLLFRPHPDVTAGLRPGLRDGAGIADAVAAGGDPARLLATAHEVWTVSSLLGFEALLRGLPVTCLGAPFYAGWGLTTDLGPVPDRRRARPPLDGLVHAALIDYPRYVDPVTGLACAPEVIVDRLAARDPRMGRTPGPFQRAGARLQGLLARIRRR